MNTNVCCFFPIGMRPRVYKPFTQAKDGSQADLLWQSLTILLNIHYDNYILYSRVPGKRWAVLQVNQIPQGQTQAIYKVFARAYLAFGKQRLRAGVARAEVAGAEVARAEVAGAAGETLVERPKKRWRLKVAEVGFKMDSSKPRDMNDILWFFWTLYST